MSSGFEGMSVLQTLENFGCQNIGSDWITLAMFAIDWWPFYFGIGMALLFVMMDRNEIYWWILSWLWFIQLFVNWGFRAAIGQTGPDQRCTYKYQNPAYSSDGLMFLVLYVSLTSSLVLRVNIGWFRIATLSFFYVIAVFARMWLHMNTPQQLLWGALSGVIWGLVLSFVTRFIFYNNAIYYFIMNSRLFGRFENRMTGINSFYPHLTFEHFVFGVHFQDPVISDWGRTGPAEIPINRFLHHS